MPDNLLRSLVPPLPPHFAQREAHAALADVAPGLCAEQRTFCHAWNLHLRATPLYADADLPSSLRAFVSAHTAQLDSDTPFRRCLLAFMVNLWKFRLLAPSELHALTAALPPLD